MATNSQVFKYFQQLPTEFRSFIIDDMEPIERCRFSGCSKASGKEAKASKNYIYGIEASFLNSITISVMYGKYDSHDDRRYGYVMEFFEKGDMVYKKCTNFNNETLWEMAQEDSIDPLEDAIEEFENLLQTYQNTVRKLVIRVPSSPSHRDALKYLDLEIDSLNQLEDLTISGHFDVHQIFSKLRRPLKKLFIDGEENSALLASYKEMFQVEKSLIWCDAQLNNEQFLKISAKQVIIGVGKLTEKDIFTFIRSWQNGTMKKEIKSCRWLLEDMESNFENQKLLRLLRASKEDLKSGFMEIKHFKKAGMSAKLIIDEDYFELMVCI